MLPSQSLHIWLSTAAAVAFGQPNPVTSSECSRCSAVRSGRTVRSGGEDRSWFGRPQAIKKATGNAAIKGTYASKVLSFQQHHPLQAVRGAVGAVYELPKKRRVPNPSPYDALPLHRRSNRRITRGSPTGRRHYDQTTTGVSNPREGRVPYPSRSTHSPPHRKGRIFMFTPLQTLPPSVEPLIKKGGVAPP